MMINLCCPLLILSKIIFETPQENILNNICGTLNMHNFPKFWTPWYRQRQAVGIIPVSPVVFIARFLMFRSEFVQNFFFLSMNT